jgi:hypothetical protein
MIDQYCKIYVNENPNGPRVAAVVEKMSEAKSGPGTYLRHGLELDVLRNDEWRPGSDDFLYFAYIVEIYPHFEMGDEEFISGCIEFLEVMKPAVLGYVAACDFEDRLSH